MESPVFLRVTRDVYRGEMAISNEEIVWLSGGSVQGICALSVEGAKMKEACDTFQASLRVNAMLWSRCF